MIKKEIDLFLQLLDLNLRKWAFNESLIVRNATSESIIVGSWKDPRTFDLRWESALDHLIIELNDPLATRITKWTILSEITRIFDSPGLVGPVALPAKLPQTFWQLVTWNESVSKSIYWIKGVSSRFQILETHVIPRCALGNDLSNRGTTWILRCFRESLRRVHILMNFRRFGNRSSFALCKITCCSPQND